MVTRSDDGNAAVVGRRLEVYARESQPLLDYYRGRPTFRSVNGAQAPALVAADLSAAIDDASRAARGARG
jgi:adenylate kinase